MLTEIESKLMDERNFKSPLNIDHRIPDKPGLYCIRIIDARNLTSPFNDYMTVRKHNIIYIGIASKSLKKRFFNQELRAKGHGTFFRTLGAVLGYRPVKGSLSDKVNKRNYKFTKSDESEIIKWINSNLIVNWCEYQGDPDLLETELITKYLPLMNLDKNPEALQELRELRAECVRIANST